MLKGMFNVSPKKYIKGSCVFIYCISSNVVTTTESIFCVKMILNAKLFQEYLLHDKRGVSLVPLPSSLVLKEHCIVKTSPRLNIFDIPTS